MQIISSLNIGISHSSKSQQEILTEQTRETVLKAFNAQMDGEIELMKSLLADNFTFTLTGQIIEQKEYLSDMLLATQLYGQEICGEKKTL